MEVIFTILHVFQTWPDMLHHLASHIVIKKNHLLVIRWHSMTCFSFFTDLPTIFCTNEKQQHALFAHTKG